VEPRLAVIGAARSEFAGGCEFSEDLNIPRGKWAHCWASNWGNRFGVWF